MKRRAAIAKIDGGTYPFHCMVMLGATAPDLFAHMKKHYTTKLTASDVQRINTHLKGMGYTGRLDCGGFVLWLRDYPRTPHDFGVLAHETFHLADMILRNVGMTLSDDSDEAWAYLIDYLTVRIYTTFRLTRSK